MLCSDCCILWYCFELDWVQKAVCYCNNSCILHYYGYNVSDSSYDIFSGVAMILLLAGMGIITFLAVESMLSQARKMEI